MKNKSTLFLHLATYSLILFNLACTLPTSTGQNPNPIQAGMIVDFKQTNIDSELGPGWNTIEIDHALFEASGSAGKPAGIRSDSIQLQETYFGVSGTGHDFAPGQKVVVSWYNDSDHDIYLNPYISFKVTARYTGYNLNSPDYNWWGMSPLRVPARGSAKNFFLFSENTAGNYNKITVCANAKSKRFDELPFRDLIVDKIEVSSADADEDLYSSYPRSSRTITCQVYSGDGKIIPAAQQGGMIEVPKGASQTFQIIKGLSADYYDLIVDGYNVTNQVINNTYTFNNVQTDHTIAVGFRTNGASVANITLRPRTPNGVLVPQGTVQVDAGQDFRVRYASQRGFTFSSMYYSRNADPATMTMFTSGTGGAFTYDYQGGQEVTNRGNFFYSYLDTDPAKLYKLQAGEHFFEVDFGFSPDSQYKVQEDLTVGDASIPSATINPNAFTYLGAFKLPNISSEDMDNFNNTSGLITYVPSGDGGSANGADAYPGSLFVIGGSNPKLSNNQFVMEFSIPAPLDSRYISRLNSASTLQGFTELSGRIYGNQIVGFTYHSGQNRLFYSLSSDNFETPNPWGNTSYGRGIGSFKTSQNNLEKQGLWGMGGLVANRPAWGRTTVMADGLEYYFNNKDQAFFMFEIPQAWADTNLDGHKTLLLGGQESGKGPLVSAVAPWHEGSVVPGDYNPTSGFANHEGLLHYTNLLHYGEYGTTVQPNSYGDSWLSGAWLEQGANSAVSFLVFFGYGNVFYNNGAGRCNWNDNALPALVLYNPADLAAVAKGTKNAYHVQAYGMFDLSPYLFHDYVGNFGVIRSYQKKVLSLAYDRIRNYLYIIEIGKSPFASNYILPVVHVFKLN